MRRGWICAVPALFFLLGFLGCSDRKGALEHFERGRLLYSEQRLKEALTSFERAIKADRALKQAYVMAAKCRFYLGQESAAVGLLEKALKVDPGYADGNFWMGKVCYFLGEYRKAEEHLMRALEEDSSHLDAHFLLGGIYFVQGSHEKALAHYSQVALSLDLIALSRVKMAEIYARSGQYGNALEELSFIEKNRELLDAQVLDQAYRVFAGIEDLR